MGEKETLHTVHPHLGLGPSFAQISEIFQHVNVNVQ